MTTNVRGALIALFCFLCSSPLLAQTSDTSVVMDQRMRTIAGDNALNCGRVRIIEATDVALKCARKAIGGRHPFLVRFDYAGMDSDLSDGLTGDSSGDVYLVRFDSLGWGGEGVVDSGHDFIEKCPRPVRIRILPWINGSFAGVTCKRRKKDSDDRYEQ